MAMEAFLFAVLCIFSRGLLNVLDRFYFREESRSFHAGVFLNVFYTLCLASVCSSFLGCQWAEILRCIQLPGVILSGLLAQWVAMLFCFSFRKMSVRAVAVSSKLADLTIPIVLVPLLPVFNWGLYLFAFFSTCAFLPIFFSLRKEKAYYDYRSILLIIVVLNLQAFVNVYFKMSQHSTTWITFFELFVAILFWRMVFCFLSSRLRRKTSTGQSINHKILLARSIMALVSQGAFFYSITRESGSAVWPILNASPLISSFLAAGILKEKFGKREVLTTVSFFSILGFYFFQS
jgi:hypothetical protein